MLPTLTSFPGDATAQPTSKGPHAAQWRIMCGPDARLRFFTESVCLRPRKPFSFSSSTSIVKLNSKHLTRTVIFWHFSRILTVRCIKFFYKFGLKFLSHTMYFGGTYICEQTFSIINKNKQKSNVIDQNLQVVLRIATTDMYWTQFGYCKIDKIAAISLINVCIQLLFLLMLLPCCS